MQLASHEPNLSLPWLHRLERAAVGAALGTVVGVLLLSADGAWWWYAAAGFVAAQLRFHPPVFWWREEP